MRVTANQWQCVAGSISNLHLVQNVDIGALPASGRYATIKVEYFGLNFADVFSQLGLYSATPTGTFVPGLEFAGVIEDVAPGVSDFRKGDKVMGVTRFGGYTTRIIADLRYVKKLPAGWSVKQGAAFPAQALTAWYGLVELGGLGSVSVGPHAVVLVQSGAGGTGLWAIKICQHFGVKVVATVGGAGKVEVLAKLSGLSENCIIDRSRCSNKNDITVALKTSLNAVGACGFTHIFDSLLGDWFEPSHAALQPMGRHIVLGAGSMTPHGSRPNWLKLAWQWLRRPLLDPLEMISTNKTLHAFNLIWLYEDVAAVDRIFSDLLAALPSLGAPHVGHTFEMHEVPEAVRTFQSGRTVGKVVVCAQNDVEEQPQRQNNDSLPAKRARK